MGHGNPMPVEMLTGYNLPDLAERSLDLMDEMLSRFSRAKKAAAEIETIYSNENGVITLSNSLIELQWKGSNGVLMGLKNKQTGTQHLGGDLFGNWTAFVDLTTSDQWSAWLGHVVLWEEPSSNQRDGQHIEQRGDSESCMERYWTGGTKEEHYSQTTNNCLRWGPRIKMDNRGDQQRA